MLYGPETSKAQENFALAYRRTNLKLIYAIVKVKKAAALSYTKIAHTTRDAPIFKSIVEACDMVLNGNVDNEFVTDALQGGAGTSTNMNVNEVLANLATEIHVKVQKDTSDNSQTLIHPLDDVNRGQSTNDVYPTALRIAAIEDLRILSESCADLQQALQQKELEFEDVAKLGRTELMDAVPITLGGEFGAYAQAISRDRWRLYKMEERLRQVNIGGAAVGLSSIDQSKYRYNIIEVLRELTDIGLAPAEYPMDFTQNNDVFVEVSGLLKALAVNLMKIANDLRLMNSGPYGGIGEIHLAPMQAGSTIMPGKVNPVIPEMVIQVAIKVMSNDFALTTAAAHGEFELNAFTPLIAETLLDSLSLLNHAVPIFKAKCIETISANRNRCQILLDESYAFATAYVARLGYDQVAKIIAEENGNSRRIKKRLNALA